jgi:hypothetical protein
MVTAFLHGAWRIANYQQHNNNIPFFYIQDNLVTTHADTAIVSMKPHWFPPNKIHLSELTVIKKPSDWMNIAKYRKKIFYFDYIRNHGLDVNITLLNITHALIETSLPPDLNVEFHIERL